MGRYLPNLLDVENLWKTRRRRYPKDPQNDPKKRQKFYIFLSLLSTISPI